LLDSGAKASTQAQVRVFDLIQEHPELMERTRLLIQQRAIASGVLPPLPNAPLATPAEASPASQAAFEEAQSLIEKAIAGDQAAVDRIVALADQHPDMANRLLAELQKGAGQ
jgi:hypothetical protein